jgi:hypothetical protein
MVSLTSWQALTERAGLRPGQRFLYPQAPEELAALPSSWRSTWRKRGNDNKFSERRLGTPSWADEVIDYKKQAFENVLSGYDIVLGTLRGDVIEKSTQILKPGGKIISLIGPLDVAFARVRGLNFLLRFVLGLMSRKIIRLTKKRGLTYSFLFVRPDGDQLARIGKTGSGTYQAGN